MAVEQYALGGLDPADSEAFEAHLGSCRECEDELLWVISIIYNYSGNLPE